jgi:TrmH family RNA methyltransferase
MLITSLDNKKIKLYTSLNETKNRNINKLFLVMGEHLVKEAINVNNLVDILVLENYEIDFDVNMEITYVTESIMKKISRMPSIPKVIGVCKIMDNNNLSGNHLLLLDNIQDPGNLGTIIRSSVAFNIDTIVLSNDTVDLYNDKVIRSTQGLLFHTNIIRRDLVEVINELKEKEYDILGTNVHNGVNLSEVKTNKFALLMGNEGQGLKEELQNMCDKNIYIPMNSNCESLNVAVATSIILYELNK